MGACDSTLRVVRDWLIDSSPAPNVESSVDVGVTAVTALPTFENILRLPVNFGSDPGNPEINTEIVIRVTRRLFDYVDRRKQVPSAFTVDQIRFTLAGCEQNLFSLSTNKRNLLSACDSPDRNVVFAVTKNSIIESNRTVLVEGSLTFVVELIRISHFSDYANGNLSGNIELFTQSSPAGNRAAPPAPTGRRLPSPNYLHP